MGERDVVEARQSAEKFQHIGGGKNLKLDIEEDKRNSFTQSSETAQNCQENFLAHEFSHRGKHEHVSNCPAFPAVWNTTKETISFLPPKRPGLAYHQRDQVFLITPD